MTKEEKTLVIEEISQKISQNNHFYIANAGGLSVEKINKLRRKCFDAGIDYKVYKNTLLKKALEHSDVDYSDLYPVLKGYSGVFFSKENGSIPAKILKEFKKDGADSTQLKGASINSEVYIGAENLDMLCTLKSREELIGDIVALLQSPAKNVISALSSGGQTIAGLIKTLSEKEG
jgi:large subunit ribosomal protein L10